MHRTHLSLYLVGYLTVAGLALPPVLGFAPPPLLSNGHHRGRHAAPGRDAADRPGGPGRRIIRLRLEALYSTTLAIRGDPFFPVVFAIVAVGVILTGASYLRDGATPNA